MSIDISISHSEKNSPCVIYPLAYPLVVLTGNSILCVHHFFLTEVVKDVTF